MITLWPLVKYLIQQLTGTLFAGLLVTQTASAREFCIWLAARDATSLGPLMVRASETGLSETNALGDFLIPAVTASPGQPAPSAFAEFSASIPQDGTYYLWGRLRSPSGLDGSFSIIPAGARLSSATNELVMGENSESPRQWHWAKGAGSQTNGAGAARLELALPTGQWTFRVTPRQASATAYGPGQWREADLTANPRLNLLCLTDDPNFVPTDEAACAATGLKPAPQTEPRVVSNPLPSISAGSLAEGHKRLPDWMRCPRWFTKDAWREELATRQPGEIAGVVREVAANGGQVLRLSCFWGGEAYFQSRVAPHAPRLGELDYLREALDEGTRTGVKVMAYMNPNAFYLGHPLLEDCAVHGPDGQVAPQATYGGGPFAQTRYACINRVRYRQFLREVIQEIFTRYQPAGLYVDGLTPHLCFCEDCQARWREMFHEEMPIAKLSRLSAGWSVWAEMGGDPQPVGDVEQDLDARRVTEMMLQTLVAATRELSAAVKEINPNAILAFHSHPKPGTEAVYDATLTEVYLTRPWVHTAWRSGELAGYSSVYDVPVLFNIYPHANCTAAEARYLALQGLANGAYPNFWTAMGMKPVFDYMARANDYLDFDTLGPVKFLAMPRDLLSSEMQRRAPLSPGVHYGETDRFLSSYVGAYSAVMRSGLPVVTLHRPHFEEALDGFQVLLLANVGLMSDMQAEAVRRFVRQGGGLLATHETSLFDEKGRRRTDFALADVLGVHYATTSGGARRSLVLDDTQPLATNLHSGFPLPNTEPLVSVQTAGAKIAGTFVEVGREGSSVPAVLIHQFGKGRVVYLPGRLEASQCEEPSPAIEALFASAVRWVAPTGLPVEVTAPGTVGVTLFRQSNRLIVHLVNHQRDTRLRSDAFTPISHVQLSVAVPANAQVRRVHRLWEEGEAPFSLRDRRVCLELGTLNEYEAVAIEWDNPESKGSGFR